MGIMYKLMKHRNLTMDLNSRTHSFESPSNIKSERSRLITIEGNIIDAPIRQSLSSEEDTVNQNMDDTNVDKQFTAEHIIQLCKFLAEKSKRNKNLHKQQQSPKRLNKSKQTQFQFQQMECENDDNVDDEDAVDLYQNDALPLLTIQRQQQQQQQQLRQRKFDDENNDFKHQHQGEQQRTRITGILSSRLSPDINSLNISTNTMASTCAMEDYQLQQQHQQQQHHQQQQQLNEQHELFSYQHQQHEQAHEHQLEERHHSQSNKRDILLKIRRQIFERKRLRENGAFEGQQQMLNNAQVWRPW